MKSLRKILLTLSFLTTLFVFNVMADPPNDNPPPPPGGGHGGGGNQQGAPIDGGMGILLALGAGYGLNKLYRYRKTEKEEGKKEE
jgi:hypothetical protein